MKPTRLVLSSLLGAAFLIGAPVTNTQTTYSDPIPVCSPNDPRCRPPVPPAELTPDRF
jgi:hypothetical protein